MLPSSRGSSNNERAAKQMIEIHRSRSRSSVCSQPTHTASLGPDPNHQCTMTSRLPYDKDSLALAMPPPSPSMLDSNSASTEYRNWITTVRIVLSVCLIYYHTNRLFDAFPHNMALSWNDRDEWFFTMVNSMQRSVLQAGLNLVPYQATHARTLATSIISNLGHLLLISIA